MTTCQKRLAAPVLLAMLIAGLPGCWASAAQPASSEALARPAQKPNGSGVDVRYRVLDKPVIGQSTRVEIVFAKVDDANGASLQLSTDPGLRLDGPDSVSLPAGETTTLTVSVVPQQDGLAYLNVFTRQRGRVSSTSIAIQTGSAAAQSKKAGPGKLKDAPGGDKILSMPVK